MNKYELKFRVEIVADDEIQATMQEDSIRKQLDILVGALQYKMRSQSSKPFPDATVSQVRTDKYDWSPGERGNVCSRCHVEWPDEFTTYTGPKKDWPYCIDCAEEVLP